MQSTPYEVKRLEYQLRVDAANRCPGTGEPEPETIAMDPDAQPTIPPLALFRHIAEGIASLTRRRERMHAPR